MTTNIPNYRYGARLLAVLSILGGIVLWLLVCGLSGCQSNPREQPPPPVSWVPTVAGLRVDATQAEKVFKPVPAGVRTEAAAIDYVVTTQSDLAVKVKPHTDKLRVYAGVLSLLYDQLRAGIDDLTLAVKQAGEAQTEIGRARANEALALQRAAQARAAAQKAIADAANAQIVNWIVLLSLVGAGAVVGVFWTSGNKLFIGIAAVAFAGAGTLMVVGLALAWVSAHWPILALGFAVAGVSAWLVWRHGSLSNVAWAIVAWGEDALRYLWAGFHNLASSTVAVVSGRTGVNTLVPTPPATPGAPPGATPGATPTPSAPVQAPSTPVESPPATTASIPAATGGAA